MGEFESEFGKALGPTFARAFSRIPWVHENLWLIATVAVTVSFLSLIVQEYLKKRKHPPEARASAGRLDLSGPFSRAFYLLRMGIDRHALDLPRAVRIPIFISIFGLFIAVFADAPYDFFTMLRVMLFVTCSIALVQLWKIGSMAAWFWSIVLIALLYNPLLPIHMHRDTWEWVNVATIGVLGLLALMIRPRMQTPLQY